MRRQGWQEPEVHRAGQGEMEGLGVDRRVLGLLNGHGRPQRAKGGEQSSTTAQEEEEKEVVDLPALSFHL